ncbi:MFS transporter [Micromonospora rosaria]
MRARMTGIEFLENYRQMFARPDIARPIAAAFVARLRDGGTPLAMVLLVQHGTGSFAVAGSATGAFGLAAALSRPLHGRLLDRLGQRVLLATAAANSAAMLAFVAAVRLGAPPPAVVAVAVLIGLLLPAQAAALRALLPDLAGERLRPAAYAVEANAQELTAISGPLIVGVLVALLPPGGALAVLAVVGFAGTVWYVTAPAARAWRGTGFVGPRRSALRAPAMWTLMLAVASISVILGVLQVALPAFAGDRDATHLAGLLLSAFAVGSLLGGSAYGAGQWRASAVHQLRVLLLVVAAGVAVLAVADGMALMTGLALVAGLGMAPAFAVTFLACDAIATAGRAAESFTWLGAANTAGFGLGGTLAGFTIEWAGPGAAFVVAATVVLTVAALLWARPDALRAGT